MPIVTRLARQWLLGLCLLIAVALVWSATHWVYSDNLNKLVITSSARLTLYDGTLREALSRYSFLPYILAQNPEVQRLLDSREGATTVNLYLEKLNWEAGSEAFYVMDTTGDTLAASNWHDELTYVGQNYRFRPYFIATQQGQTGRFFAIGATTGRPGYFFSHRVVASGRNVGAAIVKVDLRPLQDGWHNGGETVLVSDSNGVIFLSSSAEWTYKTLNPLSSEQLKRIKAGQQYGAQKLGQLPLKLIEVLADNQRVMSDGKAFYLMLSRSLSGLGWNMHHLVSLAPVRKQARLVAVNGTILALLVLALGLYLRERKQKEISRRKARESEAIRAMNIRLQEEIVEHNLTEKMLRETQDELIQAGKLASLGHMAAGIVHELSQPIAAIRTYVASCRLLLQRQQTEKLNDALEAIKGTTEHMATITTQLKSFAHKAPQQLEPIIVQESLVEVLKMTKALLADSSVTLVTNICDRPMMVPCHRGRIKQVFLNLIRNAVDAMVWTEQKKLEIFVIDNDVDVEIRVADSGIGIADHIARELYTPFVTTKDVGDGLGLGLSICNRIVDNIGGSIRGENRTAGGAQFIVVLPLMKDSGGN